MVRPIDCLICRDAGMIDFHPSIALLCFQYDENIDPLMMFLHLFRIDLMIFLLCFCYLYCSKMVYSILFLWCTNMRFKSSCLLVCPIILRLLSVLSLTAFWVLIDFHHKVTLRFLIDIGVMFKPCDLHWSYVYTFDIGIFRPNISPAVTLITIG